jgi:hypothetical protein
MSMDHNTSGVVAKSLFTSHKFNIIGYERHVVLYF